MTQVNFVNGVLLVIIGAAAVAAQPVPPVPPEAPVLAAPPAPNVWPFPAPMPDVAAIVADAKSRAFAFSFAQSRDMRDRDGRDADRNYRDGSRSLDRGEWDKAAEQFSAVIEKKGERMDGAYYWKAYALGKMGKRDEAVNLINELEKTNPKSRWLDDAKALRVELRQASGQPVSADIQNDEELKLIALNGLVDTAPDRAIPAVGDLLKKSSSPRLKERALFVLAQSRTPQARDILRAVRQRGREPGSAVEGGRLSRNAQEQGEHTAAGRNIYLEQRPRHSPAHTSRIHDDSGEGTSARGRPQRTGYGSPAGSHHVSRRHPCRSRAPADVWF